LLQIYSGEVEAHLELHVKVGGAKDVTVELAKELAYRAIVGNRVRDRFNSTVTVVAVLCSEEGQARRAREEGETSLAHLVGRQTTTAVGLRATLVLCECREGSALSPDL
jgi:hypothetical protein